VTDAVADGTGTRMRLRGRGVPRARLTLRTAGQTTRITGTVAGRRVDLRVASPV
jgi:hypothetical protein